MPKTWADFANSPAYQSLTDEEKQAAQQHYYENYVYPSVAGTDKVETARDEFFRQANPTLTDKALDLGKSAVSSVAEFAKRGVQATNDSIQAAKVATNDYQRGLTQPRVAAPAAPTVAAPKPRLEGSVMNGMDGATPAPGAQQPEIAVADIAGPGKLDPDIQQMVDRAPQLDKPEGALDVAGNALARGVKMGHGINKAIVGLGLDAVGADEMALDWLKSAAQTQKESANYPAAVKDFTHINSWSDVPTYALEGVLENAPILVESIVGGGVGAVAAQKIGREGIEQMMVESAKKELAKRTAIGAAAGAGATSIALESGSIYSDIYQETGEMRPGVAVVFGTLAGAIDAIPAARAVTTALKKPLLEAATSTLVKRYGVEGAKQVLAEGGTEFMQTWIEKGAVSYVDGRPLFNEENLIESLDAMFKGGAAGGVTHVAAQGYNDLTAGAPDLGAQQAERARVDALNKWNTQGIAPSAVAPQPPKGTLARAADIAAQHGLGVPAVPDNGAIDATELYGADPAATQPAQGGINAGASLGNAAAAPVAAAAGQSASDIATGSVPAPDVHGADAAIPAASGIGAVPTEPAGRNADGQDALTFETAKAGDTFTMNGQQWRKTPTGVERVTDEAAQATVDEPAHAAATSPANDLPEPTEAQKEAGNYKKGKISVGGLNISVENPQGSVRSGTDRKGQPWQTEMQDHYGYVTGVTAKAKDKDHVDVFVKPGTADDFAGSVFVVDQKDPQTGRFDEPKVMLGYASQEEAEAAYDRNYAADWQGKMAVTPLSMEQFKQRLDEPDAFMKPQKAPAAEQAEPTIEHDGDTWRILSTGTTREDGKVFAHLASTTRGRKQANGFNPVQMNDWIDADKIGAAQAATPEQAAPEQDQALRGMVERLLKRRAAANQVGKLKPFENVLAKAKAALKGEAVSPNTFKNAATLHFNKIDEDTRKLLLEIHEHLFGERAAQAKAEAKAKASERMKKRAEVARRVVPEKDTMIEAIAKLGGFKKGIRDENDIRGSLGIEGNLRIPYAGGFGWLFTENGTTLDGMAEKLFELGYLKEYDAQELDTLLADYRGENHSNAYVPDFEAAFEEATQPITAEERSEAADGMTPAEQDLLDAVLSELEWHALMESIAADDAVLADIARTVENEQVEHETLVREFYDAAQIQESGQDQDQAGSSVTREPAEGSQGRRADRGEAGAEVRPRDSVLESYSQQDLDAREQAAAGQRKADDEAQKKAAADSQRNDFVLTGSSRPADEAAARGAQDLFSSPSSAAATSTAPEHAAIGVDDRELGEIVTEFNQAQRSMVEDGEKVHHLFDEPEKGDIVRLGDNVKVYNKDHGWMTVAEAKARIAEWKERARAQYDDADVRSANNQRVVLSLFDLTGKWSQPWEEAGYQVYRFDIQADPEVGDVNKFSSDFFGDWFGDFDGLDIYAVLAATPCTDFASSGSRHFAAKDKDGRTVASVKLVHQTLATIEYFKPAVWAIENPVGRIEKLGGLPPWRLSFDPNHIGDPYTKKTLLWGRFNADLPIAPVEPTEGSKMHSKYGGKSLATKNARSATPEGFAYGFFMANNAADHPALEIAGKYDRLDRELIEKAVAAGVTKQQIDEAVEDFYYMDLDDEAANNAIRELIQPEPPKGGKDVQDERLAPGTRINGEVERRAADRLEQLVAEMEKTDDPRFFKRSEPETGSKLDVRNVIEELRKPRTVTDVVGVLETASSRLMRKFGAFAKVLDEVAERLSSRAPIHSVRDEDTGMEANVYQADDGRFNVVQRDIDSGDSVPIVRRFEDKQAAVDYAETLKVPAPKEVSSETARRGDFTLKSGERAKVIEHAERGRFSVSVGKANGESMESMGTFSMDDEGTVSRVAARANWAMDNVRDAAEQFAGTHRKPAQPASKFASNKLFTADKVEAARARLKSKLGTLNSGMDPELLIDGMTIAGAYIESGVRDFSSYAKAMAEDFGDAIKPYLLSFYEAARAYPGLDKAGMTGAEEAAKLHQALLTPEVKESVKDVVGEGVQTAKKARAKPAGTMTLTQDWGVDNIDGWTESPTGKNQGSDFGLIDGIKDQFLDETKKYLGQVAKLLEAEGYAAYTDRKGKPMKAVSVNEGGTAVSGDVTLTMRRGNVGVYASIGVSSLRGMVGNHPQGVAVMVRATSRADTDQYATNGTNTWLAPALNATELANKLAELGALRIREATSHTEQDYGKKSVQGSQEQQHANTLQSEGVPERDPDSGADVRADRNRAGESVDVGLAGARAEPDDGGRVPAGVSGTTAAGAGRDSGQSRELAGAAREGADGRPVDGTASSLENYTIEDADQIGKGGLGQKYRDNLAAIRIIKALESESRTATAEERKQLAKYVGWGALKGVFDKGNKQWAKQHAELKELLTPDEWRSAQASILNAHYTAPGVVKAMYEAVQQLGFTGGRILEPSMGSGNFFGLMPTALRNGSRLHGVELDNLTSRLARALYPKATIAVSTAFEEYQVPAGYFDMAIGNPPFGSEPIVDRERNEYSGFSIHNYFIARMIDKVRDGGLVPVIVSHNFLDAISPKAREWVAQRANLLAAVRLPNTAFKENAGTEVVTDILFFQKTATPQKNPAWVNASDVELENPKTGDKAKVSVNDYFTANPRHVLGKPSLGGTLYRPNDYTVESDGRDLDDALIGFINDLPAGIYQSVQRPTEELNAADNTVPDGIKQGSYYVTDKGEIRQRGNDVAGMRTSQPWVAKNEGEERRMRGMIKLRDLLRAQMRLERDPTAAAKAIEDNRRSLNKAYDDFVKANGYVNSQTNRRVFLDDTESALVQALEFDYDAGVTKAKAESTGLEEKKPSAVKADILQRRVLFPPSEVINVNNAKDALLASLNEKGRLDMEYMADVYNKTESEIVAELGDLVFNDPESGWQQSDEYLSGDVKTKLERARAAADASTEFKRNVAALEKVIPADKLPSEIYASIGAAWIPRDVYEAFAKEITGSSGVKLGYLAATAQWFADLEGHGDLGKLTSEFGTDKINSFEIFKLMLNGKPVEVKRAELDPQGNRRYVTDEEATEAARQRMDKIKSLWESWVWNDGERATRLTGIFNDKHNRTVNRRYDGAHLTFPGMSPAITLRAHQKDVVWRALQERNVLLDHVVGAGKTFAMAAIVMEMKRLGIARKPIFAVPNHLTLQWRSDFSRLYPGSNVLAATPEDFSKDNRERLFSKIATGDYDAVVIGHSSLKKIGLDIEIEQRMYKEQIDEIASAIEDMKRERGDRNIVRDMEKIKANLDAKLQELINKAGERDKVVSFDELGIDALLVDEMHEFKNLFFMTQKQRVSGLGNPKGSGKAFDLFLKVRWMQQAMGERVPFVTATGTPVSNSLSEMFTMQRYMRFDELKRDGLHLFDAWSRMYGEDEYVYEVAPSGVGYRISQRFSKFKNLPSLMGHYKSFADVVTLQDLKDQAASEGKRFPVPKIEGGRQQNIVAQRSTLQRDFFGVPTIRKNEDGSTVYTVDPKTAKIEQDSLGNWILRAEGYYSKHGTREEAELDLVEQSLTPVVDLDPKSLVGQFNNLRELTRSSKGKINALSLTGLANKAGLDYRLIDPDAPDFEGSKINKAIDNMLRVYKAWQKDKGAQLVFCDLSIPLSARAQAASKEKRLYVLDDKGELTHKKGTLHTIENREGFPYYLVREGKGERATVTAYEPVSGARLRGNFADKKEATEWVKGYLESDDNRDKWFEARDRFEPITPERVAEYRDEHELEVDDDGSNEISAADLEAIAGASQFSVYDDIKAKLMRRGIPEHEIAFIHDYNTPKQKLELFKRVNRGDVRFLLGSTPKLGAGTNVQERLVGMHHIDAPWRPSDLEQREGRIIRQGNKLYERDPDGFEVFIGRYATEQTYDTRRWQLLEHKASGIEQLRKYSGEAEIEDVASEAANAADMKAAASGNPLILEETKLRTEVKRLGALQRAHADGKYAMQHKLKHTSRIIDTYLPERIAEIDGMLAEAAKHPIPKEKEAVALTIVDGDRATTKERAEDLIGSLSARVRMSGDSEYRKDIVYRGVRFAFERGGLQGALVLKSPISTMVYYGREEAVSPSGVLTRFNNFIDNLEGRKQEALAELEQAKRDVASLEGHMDAPFAEADELESMRQRHGEVQRALMRSTQMDAVPEGERATFKKELEARKKMLRDMGYETALKEAERDAAAFRLGNPGTGLPREAVQAIADALRQRWSNAPQIIVVDDMLDSRIPVALLEENARQIAGGAKGSPLGFIYQSKVYVVASEMTTPGDVVKTLLHEVLGHYGLRKVFGTELAGVLDQIVALRRKDVVAKAKRYGLDPEKPAHLRMAAEEVLSDMAQTHPNLGFVKRAVAAIRTWLRQTFPKVFGSLELTDAEIVRDYLLPAREYVVHGDRGDTVQGAIVGAFQRQDDATAIRAINDRINAAIDAWAAGKLKSGEVLDLGHPSRVLRQFGVPDLPIHMTQSLLTKAVKRKHEVDVRDLADIALNIHAPLAVFESKADKHIVLVTEARHKDGNVTVALRLETSRDGIEINDIRSIYPKADASVGYWVEDGLLLGYQKGKGRDWLENSAASNSRQPQVNATLDKAIVYDASDLRNEPAGDGAFSRGTTAAPKEGGLLDRALQIPGKVVAERLTKPAYRAVARVVDSKYLLGNKAGSIIKAGVIADYGLDQQYLDRRDEIEARMNAHLRKGKNLIQSLAGLSREESRIAYQWLQESPDSELEAELMAQLPKDSRQYLERVKQMIDELSQEAIALGQLTPEQYERNRYAYLHRSYAKHEFTDDVLEQKIAQLERAAAQAGGDAERERLQREIGSLKLNRKVSSNRSANRKILGDQYRGRGLQFLVDPQNMGGVKELKQGQKFLRLEEHAQTGRVMKRVWWNAEHGVPALYANMEADAAAWEVRGLKNGKVILWRDFTKEERARMGELDEAKFAIATTVSKMAHDIETGKFFAWVNSAYAQDEAPEDAVIVDDAGDSAWSKGNLVDALAEGAWVKVPETKVPQTQVSRYGALAGKYVPGAIWNDIRQIANPPSVPRWYQTIMRYWKIAKTALSPAVHTNNVMANIVMADMHDVQARHVVKALETMWKARTDKTAKDFIERFEDSGAIAGTYVHAELKDDMMKPLLEELRREMIAAQSPLDQMHTVANAMAMIFGQREIRKGMSMLAMTKAGRAATWLPETMIDLYQSEDVVFRLAAFIKATEAGKTDREAGRTARKAFLDYRINAPWIQGLRHTVLPFIAFTYRMIPMYVETMRDKPWKMAKYMLVANTLVQIGMALAGIDDDEDEKIQKLLQDDRKGMTPYLTQRQIPVGRTEDGRPVYLDVTRWMPLGDIFEIRGESSNTLPIPGFMYPSGVIMLAAELMTNRSLFSGRDIWQSTDTNMEMAGKMFGHFYKGMAPNFPALPGTYSWDKISAAITDRTDMMGRQYSIGQALASAFGVKLNSYDTEVLQYQAVMDAETKMREIQGNIKRAAREYGRNGMTEEELNERATAEQEKLLDVAEDLSDKVN